jgi:hypothetical protein
MIRHLSDCLKETERRASDAEWNGDSDIAQKLDAVARRLRERIAQGEEWEPSF